MKTVLLAGGLGTRLSEETQVRPKPMVEIGDEPILCHIMRTYATYGFREFIVALGYKGEQIKQYFHRYHALRSDLTIRLATGEIVVRDAHRDDWVVHLVDTGDKTATGGRLRALADWLDDETFFLTYGDGLANVDLAALLAFHRRHGRLATVTAVHPPARFGELLLDGDRVVDFSEKPQTGEGWINGGYFVFERRVLDYIDGPETILERAPLERLAQQDQLRAFRHSGFWQPMDTLREKHYLSELWNAERAPWKVW